MEVHSLGANIGAEVLGVDLRTTQTQENREVLARALLDNVVLVIRDQSLSPAQFRDGMALFGAPMRQHREKYNLEECPDVSIVTNKGGIGKADMWHTDHTNSPLRTPKDNGVTCCGFTAAAGRRGLQTCMQRFRFSMKTNASDCVV